jgi:hypothetical protein
MKKKPSTKKPKASEYEIETVRFAGFDLPILRRKDGATPFRSKLECDAMSGVVQRYRNIRQGKRKRS